MLGNSIITGNTTTEDVNPIPSMLIVNWDAELKKK